MKKSQVIYKPMADPVMPVKESIQPADVFAEPSARPASEVNGRPAVVLDGFTVRGNGGGWTVFNRAEKRPYYVRGIVPNTDKATAEKIAAGKSGLDVVPLDALDKLVRG